MKRKSYNAIDIFKFLFSLLVVSIHAEPFVTINGAINHLCVNYIARLAVPFFFVCSGYFLFKKVDVNNPDGKLVLKYVLKTFKIYLIWSVIYMPLQIKYIIGNDYSAHAIIKAVGEYIFNSFVYSSYGQLWYLKSLIVAVLLVFVLLKLKLKPISIFITGIILYFIGLFGQTYYGLLTKLSSYDSLWKIITQTGSIIRTTRNGVFFGLVYVSMGLMFSRYDFKIKKSVSYVCMFACAVLFLGESFILSKLDWIKEYNMYIFLLPLLFFLFDIVSDIDLKDKAIYKEMRVQSSIMYYLHMLVYEAMLLPIGICNSFLVYSLTVVITLVMGITIRKLSGTKHLEFLKNLYI